LYGNTQRWKQEKQIRNAKPKRVVIKQDLNEYGIIDKQEIKAWNERKHNKRNLETIVLGFDVYSIECNLSQFWGNLSTPNEGNWRQLRTHA